MKYQAILATPFSMLGIRCSEHALLAIDWLPSRLESQPACHAFARLVCEQLQAYVSDYTSLFDIPIELQGTPHQLKVWRALLKIPRGATRQYGELAKELGSSAQAVGQACGANPIPIIVPCHRVVSKVGLGGFMHHAAGDALDIKRWLLVHEGVSP